MLIYSHGRERLNLYAGRSLLSKRKKKFEQWYFKRKETGNILLRSLRSVDRSYFLLLKMVFIPQFNCYSKVVCNDFCNPIKIKAEKFRWLIIIALNNKILDFSGKLLLSVLKTFFPQVILWRIFFTSPSNFSLPSIFTPRYFTPVDSAILSISIFRILFVNLFLVLNTIYSVIVCSPLTGSLRKNR